MLRILIKMEPPIAMIVIKKKVLIVALHGHVVKAMVPQSGRICLVRSIDHHQRIISTNKWNQQVSFPRV